MRLFKQLANITLAEAKEAVHFRDTWSDVRADHNRFHGTVEEVANVTREKVRVSRRNSRPAEIGSTVGLEI
jgi:hypothetical protein